MRIDEKEIRVVPLEDELQKPTGNSGKAPAKKSPVKPTGKTKGAAAAESVSITEQAKERNWLVTLVFAVFAAFMLTFLAILAIQLVKLGDMDKTLQVFTTVSAVVFAVVNPIIAFFFGKRMRE